MDDQLKQSALDFHEFPVPWKIRVSPTKPLATQRDLALAYSPGVAAPCLEIEKDPLKAYKYTARGNTVAVISNGTAVLGLGNIGALAGKPVMEGKGVLFKKFAGIDVFDIEVDELDPDKFIEVVAALEPTFGGINLEDIKAPECFYIEQKLRERMNIPVFHDDQHGTAIISTAAILNGLRVVEKNISDVRMVVSGAGAAAIACMNLLVALGLQKHNIVVCDSKGVIYQGREPNMAETKAAYAVVDDGKRTLDDVIEGADIFLGCSGPKVLTQEMVKKMARAPMIPRWRTRNRKSRRRWRKKCVRMPSSAPVVLTIQTSQQRPLLPVHLPWRAGRWRNRHQRRDETGGGTRDCRTGPRRTERSGGFSVWRSGSELWSGIHHSKTV